MYRNTRMCNTWITNPWPQFLLHGAISRRAEHENKHLPCLGNKPKTTRQHNVYSHSQFFHYNPLFCSFILFYSMNIWSTNRYSLTINISNIIWILSFFSFLVLHLFILCIKLVISVGNVLDISLTCPGDGACPKILRTKWDGQTFWFNLFSATCLQHALAFNCMSSVPRVT